MGVATVAIVDTNADPNVIDYPIPANDDAVGSIKLIFTYIMDAWIEGRKNFESRAQKEAVKEAKKEEKTEAKTQAPKKVVAKPEETKLKLKTQKSKKK
jgi:small subunit ribosomal protein S2